MDIVLRIKLLCEQKNITVTELERIVGIGRSTIRNWDKSSPTAEKLQKVADYFHVSVDYLLGREEHSLPPKVRTIAAHLADEDITDQKMELIMQYLNALFDEKEKEITEKKEK